jgi:8-oxo-dGTP pyrophosphatase MutT (NUDIX family)
MVAGSLLPVALNKGKLYFLFGKENPLEDSAKGWSDFGGGCEKNEDPFTTALREGSEELTGFLGNKSMLRKTIKRAGGFYKVSHNDYNMHIFFIDYDNNLPEYFNKNHLFLWKNMDKNLLNESRLFEKIEICWFSEEDLINRRKEFRPFYQEISDKIRENIDMIRQFITEKYNKKNKRSVNKNCDCYTKKRKTSKKYNKQKGG